jgi:hypothetical protein
MHVCMCLQLDIYVCVSSHALVFYSVCPGRALTRHLFARVCVFFLWGGAQRCSMWASLRLSAMFMRPPSNSSACAACSPARSVWWLYLSINASAPDTGLSACVCVCLQSVGCMCMYMPLCVCIMTGPVY